MFLSRTPRPSSEPSKKEMLSPQLVSSSSSSSSSQKPAKPAQKRPKREADQDPPQSASSSKGSHKDSSAPKHRRVEGKGSGSCTEHKVSKGCWDIGNGVHRYIFKFPVREVPSGGIAVSYLCLKFYFLEGE